MNLDGIIFLINLETIDIADIMMQEYDNDDNEEDTYSSEEEQIESLLKEKNLSFAKLNGITASIVHIHNKFKIQFLGYDELYTLSLLYMLEKSLFFEIMNYFKEPKQVKIINPSPQVGGIIDTNYGIKFTIEII